MTVVLLHPLPLDGTAWADVPVEDPVVAPTLYDLGPTVEAWAGAVVDLAGPGPLVVVGASVGASCALEVARLVPDRIDHLVLVGGKAGHRRDPGQHAAVRRVLDDEGLAGAWARIWAPLLSPTAAPDVVARVRGLALAQAPAAVTTGVDAFHARPDATAVARAHAGHLTVVRGEDDPIVGDRPPLAPARVVAGAGHYVPIERPQAMAALVADAVSRGRGGA